MIAYTTAQMRKTLDWADEAIVELVGSSMHYVSFNTISHAMLLEPAQTECGLSISPSSEECK